jgi:ADP-heptose:LPS heptosyltransferase
MLGGARRVLAVRLDTIGDVLMTTPALKAMADNGAEVTLLTSSVSSSLSTMLPYLKELITIDVPWMKPSEKHLEPHGTHLAGLDALRAKAFDGAVVYTVSTQDPACAAYLCYLCGIPRVAAHVGGKLYGLVTDPVPDQDGWPPTRHEVVRHIELARSLGYKVGDEGLQLTAPAPSRRVREVIEAVSGGPWCVVHPGATAPSRRYPNDLWAEVIDALGRRGVKVVLAGGKQDRRRCDELVRCCKHEPLRVDARLSLPELTALLAAAPAAATCNSSAAHLCAATGTLVTTLYAGTNPQHTPWTGSAEVLRRHTECTWCLSSTCKHSRPTCIASIPPAQVADSVFKHLNLMTVAKNRAPVEVGS